MIEAHPTISHDANMNFRHWVKGGARIRVLLVACVALFSSCTHGTTSILHPIHPIQTPAAPEYIVPAQPHCLRPVVPGLPLPGGLVLGGLSAKISPAAAEISPTREAQDGVMRIGRLALLAIAGLGLAALLAALWLKSATLGGWGAVVALGGFAAAYWLQYLMWIIGGLLLLAVLAAAWFTWRKKLYEKALDQTVQTVDELKAAAPDALWSGLRKRIRDEIQDETTARLVRHRRRSRK